MLEAGEDPLFIARRMVILASEDVGNSDPMALILANAAFQSVHAVGMPEARIILAQAATYLASATKSNAAYVAIEEALEAARKGPQDPVPLHLRNAPTDLMKKMGHGKGYQYAHDHPGGFVYQNYLPERLKSAVFYRPKEIGEEKHIGRRLKAWWKKRRSVSPSKPSDARKES
jgi:putative ATPase